MPFLFFFCFIFHLLCNIFPNVKKIDFLEFENHLYYERTYHTYIFTTEPSLNPNIMNKYESILCTIVPCFLWLEILTILSTLNLTSKSPTFNADLHYCESRLYHVVLYPLGCSWGLHGCKRCHVYIVHQ